MKLVDKGFCRVCIPCSFLSHIDKSCCNVAVPTAWMNQLIDACRELSGSHETDRDKIKDMVKVLDVAFAIAGEYGL